MAYNNNNRPRERRQQDDGPGYDERVVDITRVSKVIKGGRHFGFRVLVVVGDNNGKVGIGLGKSREVPDAIRKATEHARKTMVQIPLIGTTIPHTMTTKYGASQVLLRPATAGTGVIAGGGVRAVMECAGIKDILTKSLGSSNPINVVRATMLALGTMADADVEARNRNKPVDQLLPPWRKANHGNQPG